MSAKGRVLLLIGSGKRTRSTSASLGGYLIERLGERGFAAETALINEVSSSDDAWNAWSEALDRCELIVLAFPLYVDSLPAQVVRALERIAEWRSDPRKARAQRLLVLVNCGLPDARHNELALRICRRFARETGIDWTGGLALGGGEAIRGRPLVEIPRLARHVIRALDLSAAMLAAGRPVPSKAVRLMAKPILPSRLYTWIGSRHWKRSARKHGAQGKLKDRPYRQSEVTRESC